MKSYPVIEVFESIQGEGAYMGMAVNFIRFAGCNLHCPWCDSKETWGETGTTPSVKSDEPQVTNVNTRFKWITTEEIVDLCNQKIVVLTGGEPLLQDLTELIESLHEWDKMICIETNGTLPTPEGIDWVVASPKPENGYFLHPECEYDELKYVVSEEFNPTAVPEIIHNTFGRLWLQPCDYSGLYLSKDEIEERNQKSKNRCAELAMEYPYMRVGIQLHKYLNVQ